MRVAAITNSLIFDCAGEPLLIMSSGAGKVDTNRVSAALGGITLKRASPDFVKQATGQVIGGVAPAGHRHRMRTLIDSDLRDHDPLWVAAGTADSLVAQLGRVVGAYCGDGAKRSSSGSVYRRYLATAR